MYMNKILKALKRFWEWILSLFIKKQRKKEKSPSSDKYESSLSNSFNNSKSSLEKLLTESYKSRKVTEKPKKSKKVNKNTHVIRNDFSSINSLLITLKSSTNNSIMAGCNNAYTIPYSHCLTQSYEEAESLIKNGYSAILPRVKKLYNQNIKILTQQEVVNKSKVINNFYGGVPNVPQALMCLPKDLIYREKQPRKEKTITIIYVLNASAFNTAEELLNKGVTLLSAINLLETSGIRIRLYCCFYAGFSRYQHNTELVLGTVLLKDYADKLNLLKMCFPLCHPSMLRRFGLKYIETVEGLTLPGFIYGYGSPAPFEMLSEVFTKEVVITFQQLNTSKYDTKTLIKYIISNAKK